MPFRWIALLASVFLSVPLAAADWSADEKAVWQLEEDYWRYVSAGDVDSYVKLWHDDFVGWPCFEWKPARKGDTIIVHYAAEYAYDYGDGTRSGVGMWRKFTHTWMRVGKDWQIIGGMCAAQEPVKAPRG